MNEIKGELAVGLGLVALLFIIFNPWGIFMPGYVVMGLLTGPLFSFPYLWRSSGGRTAAMRRERFHQLFADRLAYLAGSGVLLLAIIGEELAHTLDPWLLAALVVMIIAKVVALMYGKTKL